MNNKGQSGSIFIILIPIIFITIAFLYENAVLIITNNRYKNISQSIAKDALTNTYQDKINIVKDLYDKNGYDIKEANITYENNILSIYNNHTYQSIFGNILGIKLYKTEVDFIAYKENNEIIIKENKKE